MDVSEQELIAAITRVLSGLGPEVLVGVGDDAAVLQRGQGEQVITTDAMVEHTHFERSTTSARDLGYKAISVNVSDIAAMGASPRAAVCALTLSDAVDAAWTMELFGGMRQACDEYALWLVGGNLARGGEVSVTVTLTGEVAPRKWVSRSGARPGDVLVVTGSLGGAAAGLRIGGEPPASWSSDERGALERLHRPVARVGEGQVLATAGATAMIDISDGLGIDLARICAASRVAATLDASAIPLHAAATLDEALTGGEDYELLAALPPDAVATAQAEIFERSGVRLHVIGRFDAGEGVTLVEAGGRRSLEPAGWDHFA